MTSKNNSICLGAAMAGLALVVQACSISTTDTGSGDGAKETASDIQLPDSIAEKGAIDVGAFFNYPPYTEAKDGGVEGVEADLVRAVGEELGVEVRFHDLAFEAMIPSVVNGRSDMLIGPFADTAERRKEVSFIDVSTSLMRALVPNGNPENIDTADLCGTDAGETSGTQQAVLMDKIAAHCKAEGKPEVNLLKFTEFGASFLAVANGRTDFTLQDPVLAARTDEQNPDLEMLETDVMLDQPQPQGWIIQKDDMELGNAIAQAIVNLNEDGTWGKITGEAGLRKLLIMPPTINTEPVELD